MLALTTHQIWHRSFGLIISAVTKTVENIYTRIKKKLPDRKKIHSIRFWFMLLQSIWTNKNTYWNDLCEAFCFSVHGAGGHYKCIRLHVKHSVWYEESIVWFRNFDTGSIERLTRCLLKISNNFKTHAPLQADRNFLFLKASKPTVKASSISNGEISAQVLFKTPVTYNWIGERFPAKWSICRQCSFGISISCYTSL